MEDIAVGKLMTWKKIYNILLSEDSRLNSIYRV